MLYNHAATRIWAEAARKTNSLDPGRIAEVVEAQGRFTSVLGQTSFEAKRDPTVPDDVFSVWREGTYAEM